MVLFIGPIFLAVLSIALFVAVVPLLLPRAEPPSSLIQAGQPSSSVRAVGAPTPAPPPREERSTSPVAAAEQLSPPTPSVPGRRRGFSPVREHEIPEQDEGSATPQAAPGEHQIPGASGTEAAQIDEAAPKAPADQRSNFARGAARQSIVQKRQAQTGQQPTGEREDAVGGEQSPTEGQDAAAEPAASGSSE